jgi:hypothetical protein
MAIAVLKKEKLGSVLPDDIIWTLGTSQGESYLEPKVLSFPQGSFLLPNHIHSN